MRNLCQLRFADRIIITAQSKDDLQEMPTDFYNNSKVVGSRKSILTKLYLWQMIKTYRTN